MLWNDKVVDGHMQTGPREHRVARARSKALALSATFLLYMGDCGRRSSLELASVLGQPSRS